MSTQPVLVLSRVAKTYRAGVAGCAASVDVLRDVSLSVRAGEFQTIEGQRGAGKTTLLMCAAGLLQPDRGVVQWPALASRVERAPPGIAYAAERAPMYGFLTVRESLAYARAVRKPYEADTEGGADALLDLTGLAAVSEVRVGLLAPSDRARLIIALMLTGAPRLLLVDDLCGGSGFIRDALARTLEDIAASGIGVLWAFRTDDANAIAGYALADGRLARPRRVTAGRKERRVPVPAATEIVHVRAASPSESPAAHG